MPNSTLYDAVTKFRKSVSTESQLHTGFTFIDNLFQYFSSSDKSNEDESTDFNSNIDEALNEIYQSLQIDVVEVESIPSTSRDLGDIKIYQGKSETVAPFYRILDYKGVYYLFSYNVVFGAMCEPLSQRLPRLYADHIRGKNSTEIDKKIVIAAVTNYLLSQPETLVDESKLYKIVNDKYESLPINFRMIKNNSDQKITSTYQARSHIPTIPQEEYAIPNSKQEFPIKVKNKIKEKIREKLDDYSSEQAINAVNTLAGVLGVVLQSTTGVDASSNLEKTSKSSSAIIARRQQHYSQLILASYASDKILDKAIDTIINYILQKNHLFIDLIDGVALREFVETIADSVTDAICSGTIFTNNREPEKIFQNFVSRINEYIDTNRRDIFNYRNFFSANNDFTRESVLVLASLYDEHYYVLDHRPFSGFNKNISDKSFVVRRQIASNSPQQYSFMKLSPAEIENARHSELTNSVISIVKSPNNNNRHQMIQNSAYDLFKLLKRSPLRMSIFQAKVSETMWYKHVVSTLVSLLLNRLNEIEKSRSKEVIFAKAFSTRFTEVLKQLSAELNLALQQQTRDTRTTTHSPRAENLINSNTNDQIRVPKPDLQNNPDLGRQKMKRTHSTTTAQSTSPNKRRNTLSGDSYGRLYSHSSSGTSSAATNSTSRSSFLREPVQR